MNELVFYIGLYSICLTLVILSVLLVKALLSRLLSAKGQYQLWLVLFAAAAVPFLPKDHTSYTAADVSASFGAAAAAAPDQPASAGAAIRDLAVNSTEIMPRSLAFFLAGLWLCGMLLLLVRLSLYAFRTRRLRAHAAQAEDPAILEVFDQCKMCLNLRRGVWLGYSDQVRSPVTFGILRLCILLPSSGNGSGLKYVFLHELAHCKRKDALFKLLTQIFLIFNWFNPAVWFAAARIENDRESACDSAVLDLLDAHERASYGRALISWASGSSRITPALNMSGSKKQLRSRIVMVARHSKSSRLRKRTEAAIASVLILLTLAFVPPASALADSSYEAPAGLSISYQNMEDDFGSFDGSFVLYDRSRDRYTIYNETAAKTRVSPNSTYKIYSALFALQSGVISPQHSARKWNGADYAFDRWKRDQTLVSAMKDSVNWYFQGLDQQSGKKRLQNFYSRIGYGNCDLSAGLSDYWLESSLKISPLEQVMLLADLYENTWNFKAENVQAVKASLLLSSWDGSALSGKTGTGMIDGHMVNGWFVGYVEKDSDVYFFAVNIQGSDGASGSRAVKIAENILSAQGII